MRTLDAPPSAVVDSSRALAVGSYRGSLPQIDLGPLGRSFAYRATHRKKWFYVAVASEKMFAALAIVDLGYASKTFAFVCADGRMLADCTALARPGAVSVSDGSGDGAFARFHSRKADVRIQRSGETIDVSARFRELDLSWSMDAGVSHAPISAIASLPGGGANATEKQVLLPAHGTFRAGGVERAFEGALGGYDYTHGYLARHTQWRWGFLMGRAEDGTQVAMNLVQGFVGEGECALWIGDELLPVGEGRFEFERGAPGSPWRVRTTCGAVDLALAPWCVHGEDTNLGIVRARFVQPIGVYRGTVRGAGRTLTIDGALGVAEDQDVLW